MSQLAGIWAEHRDRRRVIDRPHLLALLFVGTFERIAIVGLWLLIAVPIAWAFRVTRLRR